MRNTSLLLLAALLSLAAIPALAQKEQGERAYQPQGPKFSAELSGVIDKARVQRDETGQVRRVRGEIQVPGASNRRQAALGFLKANAKKLNLSSELGELRIAREFDSPAGHHVVFDQVLNGEKVFGGSLGVHLDKKLAVINANLDLQPVRETPVLAYRKADPVLAIEAAIAAVPSSVGPSSTPVAERGYLLDKGIATLAWRITFDTVSPGAAWEVFVDASTDRLISKRNIARYADGSGFVFDPNPVQTSGNAALADSNDADNATLTAQRVNVALKDLTQAGGVFQLQGPFARARLNNQVPSSANGQFNFTRSSANFNAVMSYYHIDKSERHIQSLGFNNIQNRQVTINVDAIPDDQSFYSPATTELTMGTGGVDDAEDADIIWHEFGHSIQDNQVPGWGDSHEGGSMGEGFGDYWAASAFAGIGPNSPAWDVFVGEWDAVSYNPGSGGNPAFLRRVDSNKHYPDSMTNEVHDDGEIWSACLWQVRTLLGRTKADRIVLQSHFFLSPTATFADGALAILQANQQLYADVSRAAIRQIFVDRGILAEETPVFTISGTVTENSNPLPGATLTLTRTLSGQYDQTASPNLPIPDANSTGVTSTIDVPVTATLTGVSVKVDILHPFRGDVSITLIHPDGTQVRLKVASSDSADNVITTYPDLTAPTDPLTVLNGKAVKGLWKLVVKDTAATDTGTFRSWTIIPKFTTGAFSRTTTTIANGTYSFGDLKAGTYTVTPSMAGKTFTPTNASVTVGPNGVANFQAGATVNSVLQSLTLNPTTLVGGNNSTGTITVSPAAGAGGAAVTLSDNSAAASEPASVTVAQGATTATFTAQTFDVSANTTVTISAVRNGVTKTATLSLTPGPALNALILDPSTVVSGSNTLAKLFLVSAAPTNGAIINLADNTSVINTPATAMVNGGNTSVAATLTTSNVSTTTTRQVTATRNGVTKTANLTLTPGPVLSALTITPSTVTSGLSTTGKVTLNLAAPASGAAVTLTDNTSVVNEPASVTVASGATFANFTITTTYVSATTTRQVSASRNGVTKTANITLLRGANLAAVSVSPSTVKGGNPTTGTVTLDSPAPAGGAVVSLTDNTTVITVPASATVAAGATTKTFTVTTSAVSATATRTITATRNGISKTANLTLTP